MNTGEVLRRTVFNLLDASKGGKLQKLKEVNKREIVEGVTEEYMERRLKTLLDYVKKNGLKIHGFAISTKKKTLLELYKEDVVSYIQTTPQN